MLKASHLTFLLTSSCTMDGLSTKIGMRIMGQHAEGKPYHFHPHLKLHDGCGKHKQWHARTGSTFTTQHTSSSSSSQAARRQRISCSSSPQAAQWAPAHAHVLHIVWRVAYGLPLYRMLPQGTEPALHLARTPAQPHCACISENEKKSLCLDGMLCTCMNAGAATQPRCACVRN
eukprot:932808-Pelagomonas_calceolata.AAC.1